jgi:hypothetical protein
MSGMGKIERSTLSSAFLGGFLFGITTPRRKNTRSAQASNLSKTTGVSTSKSVSVCWLATRQGFDFSQLFDVTGAVWSE